MLGASKAISASIAVQTYGVFITPGVLFVNSPPGSATTGLATANVTGEVGPVTFLWERVSGDSQISIDSPTSSSTTFSASGNLGKEFFATFRVTVTDTGNADLETTDTITVSFIFGNA